MRIAALFTVALIAVAAPMARADTKAETSSNEISAEDAKEFLGFFNKFVDAIVQNKDDCTRMAGGINAVIDANQDLIRKANAYKASGKKLPKALEEQMMARVKEMMPAMQKCGADKGVQAALKRMDQKK